MKLRLTPTAPRRLSVARSALIGVLAGAGVYSLAALAIGTFVGEGASALTYHAIAATGALGLAVGVARSLISSSQKTGQSNEH